MSQDDVRFGVIGYGLFGTHHASAISKTDGAGLAAIAVKSEESRRAAMEAHPGCEVLDDWRALIDRADIDVVDVVVPNAMHHEVTMAALGAGKHVLLEKPMAIEVAHCEELVALAASTGKVLAVVQGHNHINDYREFDGIHYCTLEAMVDGSGAKNSAYAVFDIHADGSMRIDGFRKQKDHAWPARA